MRQRDLCMDVFVQYVGVSVGGDGSNSPVHVVLGVCVRNRWPV